MKGYILSSQKFHEIKYDILGDNYQRKHPVEYVIKFAKISKIRSRLLVLGSGNG